MQETNCFSLKYCSHLYLPAQCYSLKSLQLLCSFFPLLLNRANINSCENSSTSRREISAKLGQAQSRAFKVLKSLRPPERSGVHNKKPWCGTGRNQDGKKLHWCPKDKLTTTLDAWRSEIGTSRVSSWREPYLDHHELTLWWALKSPFVTCRLHGNKVSSKPPPD